MPGYVYNPRCVASNAAEDTLYFGGMLPVEGEPGDGFPSNSVFRYVSGQWDTLGVFQDYVNTLVIYHDTIFAAGEFEECSGQPCGGIAFHDGTNWRSYGDLEGRVHRLRVLDDTLYAVGGFAIADGLPAQGIARHIGGQWTSVGQMLVSGSNLPYVSDVTKYAGELVIVGSMTINGIRGIHHLVGEDWLPLGQGVVGGLSSAHCLAVFQDQLYVAGQLSVLHGNAGQDIMRWDGTQYHPLGSGLQTVLNSDAGTCTGRMMVHGGLLWVGSGCNYAGGVPARGLATWDGTQWCGVPGDLAGESSPVDMAFYRDTLFLAFVAGGGETNGAAKFVGESYFGECGSWATVEEGDNRVNILLLPNPTNGLLQVEAEGLRPQTWWLTDALGRKLVRGSERSDRFVIDLGDLRSGLYHLTLQDVEGLRWTRTVVRE